MTHPFRIPRGAAAALAGALLLAGAAPSLAADCSAMEGPNLDWQGCNKSTLVLKGMSFAGANLVDVNFTSTDLRNTDLSGANLEKATLFRAALGGAKADKTNFTRIEAYRTSFTGMSAKQASFASAELQRADFSGADLTGADFQKAELGRANLASAIITGTRFTFANLSRADIHATKSEGPIDFSGAFLFLTRIEGMDLSAATGLEQAQIDHACGDAGTKLPAGLKPGPTWPCPFGFD